MTNLVFLTFGAGCSDYINAVNRITEQAKNCNIFDKIISYNDEDLKKDTNFWNLHSNFILNNPKGFGYWIWKPYIILKTLQTLEDNDLLLYLDSGCEIYYNNKHLILNDINKLNNRNILCQTATSTDLTYTKKDLLDYFNLDYNLLNLSHVQAGAVFIKKNDLTIKLYNEFYNLCCINNYHFLDDTPSITPNLSTFIEHRHDQSIFNMLIKKYNLYNNDLSASHDKDYNNCIWTIRNRTGNYSFSI